MRAHLISTLMLGFLFTGAGAGCQRAQVRLLEAMADKDDRPVTRVEPASSSVPAELPPLPSTPIRPASGEPRSADEEAERETPLLDAALSRASHLESTPSESATAARPEPLPEPKAAESEPIALPDLSGKSEETPAPAPAPKPEATAPKVEPPKPGPEAAPPETKPINPDRPKDVAAHSREPWRDGLTEIRAVARLRAGGPGDQAEEWRIRSRVLDWMADDAHTADHGATWSSVLSALSTATGPETAEPNVLAPRIREAVEALESLSPLTIVDLQLCRKILAFGSREPLDAKALHAGQAVLLYCELSGLRYEPDESAFHSRLAARAEIVPAGGGVPVWSEALGTADDTCRRRRRDYYVNYRLVLPSTLAPGAYRLRLTEDDVQSGQSAAASLDFQVIP